MRKVIQLLLLSALITVITVLITLYSAKNLNAERFALIAFFTYFIPLVAEISMIGQNFSIIRDGKLDKNIKLNSFKVLTSSVISLCGLLVVYFKYGVNELVPIGLALIMFVIIRFSGSFARAKEQHVLALLTDKSVQIVIGLVYLLCIYSDALSVSFWISFLSMLICVVLVAARPSISVFANVGFNNKTDTKYEINMLATVLTMLLVNSVDKIVIHHYFSASDFSMWIILFQIYFFFPFVGGALFNYKLPSFSRMRVISYSKKLFILLISLSFVLVIAISYAAYWALNFYYKEIFQFSLISLILLTLAGVLYFFYQALAIVLVAHANNNVMFRLNLNNILSVSVYVLLLSSGVYLEAFEIILLGLVMFWISKTCIAIYLLKEVEEFKWI